MTEGFANNELERYRRILQAKAQEVRQRLSAGNAAEVVQCLEEPLDFGDRCQKSHEEWLFLNQNRMEVALLRELEDALHRLGQPGFGLCEECGRPIPGKRLAAVPWARFCLGCQEGPASAPVGG